MTTAYEQITDELAQLRLERDQADARLLLRLVDIETTPELLRIVMDAGHDSFGQFCSQWRTVSVYSAFKKGLSVIGRERALEVGSYATQVAAKLTDDPTAPERYVSSCINWSVEHNGVAPSLQTANDILRDIDPRPRTPRHDKRQNELNRLRAENAELLAENRLLRMRLERYERRDSETKSAAAS